MKTETKIDTLVAGQRAFFAKGKTRDVNFRLAALRRLRDGIRRREKEIAAALPRACLQIIPGAGHEANRDAPAQLALALARFRNTHS